MICKCNTKPHFWYFDIYNNYTFMRLYNQRLHSSCLVLKVYEQKYIVWTTYYFSQATKMFMFDALCARIFWYAPWYTETIKITWNIWHSCFSVKCESSKKKKKSILEVNFRKYKIYFWKFCLCDICHTHKVYFLHPPKFDTQQIKPFGTAVFNALAITLINLLINHLFLNSRTHLKRHVCDCQIISSTSFSINCVFYVECVIWDELRQRKKLFYSLIKDVIDGHIKDIREKRLIHYCFHNFKN